ncbi:hypothetical protein BX070DRAFT_186351 [Coemansia spiralis]|nr:hypothetical protein BX070DRAFT_186351 [Coemansia spiralis]
MSDPSLDPFAPPPSKKVRSARFDDPFGPSESSAIDNDGGFVVKTEDASDDANDNSTQSIVTPNEDNTMDIAIDDTIDDAMLTDLDWLDATDTKPVLINGEPLYAKDSGTQGQSWMDVQMEMANTHTPQLAKQESTLSAIDAVESSSDVLHMYWIDALEKNGNLYLVGKRYSFLQVHKEFESMVAMYNIRLFECGPVERKYAFEIRNVPASAEYLKVAYGFDQPALPADLSGKTFEQVFGTTYSALELFLLKRRMMGPCWLELKNANAVDAHDRISWCRLEVSVEDPKDISVMTDDHVEQHRLARTPTFTTMTLSLKTVMNHKDNSNEIVAISMLVHRNLSLDDPTPAAKRSGDQHTVVRQLTGMPLPADFTRLAQTQSKRGLAIEVTKTESALLNFFTAFLHRTDPDILVAHNFYGFDLDVLLHRMRALRIDGWSKLGRLRRTQWPKLQAGAGGMGESTFGERQIVSGRVVCDTYMASKDLIRAKSYSLTNLASQELQIRREELPFERIPEYFSASKSLLHFIRHTAFDAFLAVALMIHLQALPLTKQLTNLAGNLWARTLMGARAERNEFLLLHEFYNSKFIRPDKFFGAKAQQPVAATDKSRGTNQSSGTGTGNKGGRRKPAYLGGLVLEPKRGFYDRFVLLLDFNSLYPSIIQEFNICFTTVRRPANADEIPDAPPPDLVQGILPRLLKTLVDRRRQVKQLLKRPGLSSEETEQLDVRQRALKLTANSMYGCLGFTHSRFYAKPLAMLITSRGREILQATRDLALSEGLEVIYGDTDSIMIATRTASLADVYELGAQFKRRVNDRYRLLELDIDGVFKRLLLLKKKKYAALQIISPEKHIRGNQVYTTKLETKGLDLVRRDWCGLSHDVSDYVLKQLFADSPASPDTSSDEGMVEQDESAVIARIHEHLVRVGNAVRAQQVPLDKYIVHKGLTKPPENYPDKKSQPHVLVALQLREKGTAVRLGDTIPYIICDPKCPGLLCTQDVNGNETGSTGSYAERARHPDEIRDSGGELYPDFEWYLNQQVLPPCARLLEPMTGTDMSALAQCLGLDPSKYRGSVHSSGSAFSDSDALRTLDSQITDAERFKFAQPFTATCPSCKKHFQVEGIARRIDQSDTALESGLSCTHCKQMPSIGSLSTQLALQIRRHIREYYAFTMVCDEPSCGLHTRALSAAGTRCLRPNCSGKLHETYSDKMLYHQLQYFSALLNIDRSAVRLECPSTDVRVLRDRHVEYIRALVIVVDNYLSVSARKFVNLSSLFSFCRA